MTDPIETLKEYIAAASVSTDPAYAEGMQAARDFITTQLTKLDFEVEVLEMGGLHPIVFAERMGDPSWPHIAIYGHYDVQPTGDEALWTNPPFEAEVRDGRIYGRGAADNKGPTIVHMAALARVLERYPDLPLNISYVIEGEEEVGSSSMPRFFEEYGERLSKASFMLVSDTGGPSADQLVINTGLRGVLDLEITVSGPKTDLHSGLHGGAVYNPLQALMEICVSLHNSDGSVNVPGFYDGIEPIPDWEREELQRCPETVESYQQFLDVPGFYPANGLNPLEAIRFGPTLEFNGIGGGYQGEGAMTVIGKSAFAKLTCRLVAGQEPERIRELVKTTIQERCPEAVRLEIREGGLGDAFLVVPPGKPNTPQDQSPLLAKAFEIVDRAVEDKFGNAPIYLRGGGSIPVIADFKRKAGLDSLMLGLLTPDDNIHAPDESFDLSVMERGIAAFDDIFCELAGLPTNK